MNASARSDRSQRPPARGRAVAAFAAALLAAGSLAVAGGPAPFAEGRLWRIDKPGVEASYVFGTIHLADPRIASIPPPALEALSHARLLAMELIPGAAAGADLSEQEGFRDGRRLAPLVGADAYAKLEVLLAAAKIPAGTIERMKPWAALLRISEAVPSGDVRSLDEQLFVAARVRRIEVTSLEWVDEQIAAFDSIPLDSQVALLRHVLDHRDVLAAEMAKTVDAWLAGDLAALARSDERLEAQYPGMGVHYRALAKQIIEGRTVLMHHRLFLPLRSGRVFVAVGASHLYGERGLLALIERDGFRVTRLW